MNKGPTGPAALKAVHALLAAAVLSTSGGAAAAQRLFKCTDSSGRTQYQQVPCEGRQQQDKVRVYTGPGDPAEMNWKPYEASPDEPAVIDPQRFTARFFSAVSSLGPVKVALANYYHARGSWPETLRDVGYEPREMRSSLIEKVVIGREGAIVARLTTDFGMDKKVVLRPKPVMGDTSIEWECHANFPARAMMLAGERFCRSRGGR